MNNSSILNIAGRTSNELYTVSVPANLLNFCNFDFTYFMEESSRLCREGMKTGEYPSEEVTAAKNAITNCHKFFENNMRGTFDKIVVDSWIEYICRQGEIGTTTLWNTFAGCKNSFQRVVFQRLSEYRSHRAINQWVNLLKMQEYARKKIDFVFGGKLNNVSEAVGRLNLFDLMFSVAANEQGYSLDAIGSVRVFKGGRLPNAPFVFGGASKEVVRNLFKDVHFADKLPYASRYEGAMSDWEAMDAFAVIKAHLPEHSDNVANTIMKSMAKLPETVYLPSGFKAMIDLEIDALVNGGAFLQRCRRCKEYYIRDDYYNSEYCDTVHRDGTTCREIMETSLIAAEPPSPEQLTYIKEASESAYRDMSAKLGTGLSQHDFSEWLGNFNTIRNKALGGEADISVFEEFVRSTKEYIAAQEAVKEAEEVVVVQEDDRHTVKPYQFTRIDRSELVQQGLLKKEREYPNESPGAMAAAAESAAASVTPTVSRIIRGVHPTSYQEIPLGHDKPVIKKESVAAAGNAGEAARAAIQSIEAQAKEKAQTQAQEKEKEKQKEDGRVHLPELEDFAQTVPQRERRAPQVKLPDFQVKTPETGSRERVTAADTSPRDAYMESPGRSAPEDMRLRPSRTVDQEQSRDRFTVENVRLREDRPSVKLYDREEENKLPEYGRQENRVERPDFGRKKGQPDFVVDDEDTDFVNLEERLEDHREKQEEREKQEAAPPRKSLAEVSKAARVVSAYKTVNDMPDMEDDESASRVMDDFAKILDNIERNDGFDEDEVPLDQDGIPLSHKTKHVMDAIMKNTRVSPSLIYGRRQAAEQNVVIDEPYRKNDEQ